jgi:aryl-alcohol dehydrogenase-like predicted oxidoreductase
VILGGRDVGVIGLGTAPVAFKDVTFGQAVATVHAAADVGVRLVDTALAYTRPGHDSFAEAVVAAALGARSGRDGVLVATKGGHRRVGDGFPIDASPAALRADCDMSLRTLGVEMIDLYQLHHVDPRVPLEESVTALRDLKDAGKIAMIGLSNVGVDQIERARAVTSTRTPSGTAGRTGSAIWPTCLLVERAVRPRRVWHCARWPCAIASRRSRCNWHGCSLRART